jgi:hypothetical protein
MEKISNQQAAQLNKLAASTLRALSEENTELRTSNEELTVKVASYQKKEHAETIAVLMEEKGLNTELSFAEKVASILERTDLEVLEKAVGMSAPQMKLASVHDDSGVEVENSGDDVGDKAASDFANRLATLE